MKETELLLGCIGDDFTGSSDAASFLAEAGLKTILVNGEIGRLPETDAEAIVIALKTRSAPKKRAVQESLAALQALRSRGAKHIYVKYCSTFDSTREGNIGPILDAFMEEMAVPYTILCPSLPVNGRIVKDGILFVNGTPLAKSPMKDHPLNPMWASRLQDLMQPQSIYPCLEISHKRLDEATAEEIISELEDFKKDHPRFYVIPDYINQEHAGKISQIFSSLPLLSGGSGLLTELADRYKGGSYTTKLTQDKTEGCGIVFAGSCSKATLRQIEVFQESGGKSFKLDPNALRQGDYLEEVWSWAKERLEQEVLLYSSDTPENIHAHQDASTAELLEKAFACLAKKAQRAGVKRFVVAGGETSGSVAQALGFHAFVIGNSVAPGVPIMIPTDASDMRVVLKSGNFGQEDFFRQALDMTRR
ncbi:four-carbon acid sugar kinase family protein [Selenomonas sp. TAMA-11512]|uniref:3-oxo-tetronate kinase n=1 Tax=Selenomonas sp. TAMA-11512 TaxID=3095337 RepID=UPI0030930180|nr:four-carbon acid sugar kinase family protein [Selenomonas sp. TAMA-11512]